MTPYKFYAAGGGFQGVTNQFAAAQNAANTNAQARFNAERALASDDMQYARMVDDVARANFAAAQSLDQVAWQRALQERDREERRGDTLFNRRLMLGQEGREQARLNLAERKFKADEDAFNKQLELDSKLEGQEGEALARGYMEIVPQLKSLDEQLEGLRDTDELLRKDAVAAGLVVGQKGFGLPSGTGMLDPAKQQALQTKMSEVNVELKRIEDLKKAAQTKQQLLLRDKYALDRSAGRLGAVLTERGLEGRGRIIPFPQVPAAPTAVGGGPPVTEIPRLGNGRLGPVPGATPPPVVARQTDEEFGAPAPLAPAPRTPAFAPSPSPARQQLEAAGPLTDETFRTAVKRLEPSAQNEVYRAIREMTFRELGLNPFSEQLRIGESRFFRNPDTYMRELAQTEEFDKYWKSLDPGDKSRILQAALLQAETGNRYSRFGIDLPSYGPAGSAQRFE